MKAVMTLSCRWRTPGQMAVAASPGENSEYDGMRGIALLVLLHDALVGLRAGVDLVLQRVQLQLADAIELIGRQRHVRHQCEQAHHEERRGVVRGRDGGEHVGELGHRHHEHDPERQRLRPMLEPCAARDEERRDGAGQKQRQAAVGRVVRDAVVGIGEVPKVVGDDPGPDHIGLDHVLRRVLRDEDAEPAADRDDVQDAGDAVHDVPRTRNGPEVLNDAALPQPEAEHLEVANDGLGNVDCQNERREAQRPALLVQVVGLAVLAAPFHEAQRDEPKAPCQRGIGLHPVEPGGRAVLVAGGDCGRGAQTLRATRGAGDLHCGHRSGGECHLRAYLLPLREPQRAD